MDDEILDIHNVDLEYLTKMGTPFYQQTDTVVSEQPDRVDEEPEYEQPVVYQLENAPLFNQIIKGKHELFIYDS